MGMSDIWKLEDATSTDMELVFEGHRFKVFICDGAYWLPKIELAQVLSIPFPKNGLYYLRWHGQFSSRTVRINGCMARVFTLAGVVWQIKRSGSPRAASFLAWADELERVGHPVATLIPGGAD